MERRKFIYKGVRLNVTGKKRYIYQEITVTELLEFTPTFSRRICRMEMVGDVISSEVNEETFTKSEMEPRVTDDHPAFVLITEYSTEHRAALIRYDMNAEMRKKHPETVEGIILKLKETLYGYNKKERARIALYIYTQLI